MPHQLAGRRGQRGLSQYTYPFVDQIPYYYAISLPEISPTTDTIFIFHILYSLPLLRKGYTFLPIDSRSGHLTYFDKWNVSQLWAEVWVLQVCSFSRLFWLLGIPCISIWHLGSAWEVLWKWKKDFNRHCVESVGQLREFCPLNTVLCSLNASYLSTDFFFLIFLSFFFLGFL